MNNPPPRPALRKAPDSDLHPVSGKKLPAANSLRPVIGIGGRTSDTLTSPGKVKKVDLGAKVDKRLRKAAREAAKKDGTSIDRIVSEALIDYLRR